MDLLRGFCLFITGCSDAQHLFHYGQVALYFTLQQIGLLAFHEVVVYVAGFRLVMVHEECYGA